MTTHSAQSALSLDDYLVWENAQAVRNEFHCGVVHTMADLRRVHGCVMSNLIGALGRALDGTSCQVFANSMKLQIGSEWIFYPDVFVTCDPADLRTELIFRAPILVIEMLWPSTAAEERSARRAVYRRVESLREIVLIDPDSRRIESWQRADDGDWQLLDMASVTELQFQSIDFRMPIVEIFDGVEVRAD